MLLQSSGRSVLVLPMRPTFVLTEWCVLPESAPESCWGGGGRGSLHNTLCHMKRVLSQPLPTALSPPTTFLLSPFADASDLFFIK